MPESSLPTTRPQDVVAHVTQLQSDLEAGRAKAQEDGKKLRDQAAKLLNSAPKPPA
jgi:hypothetical protein